MLKKTRQIDKANVASETIRAEIIAAFLKYLHCAPNLGQLTRQRENLFSPMKNHLIEVPSQVDRARERERERRREGEAEANGDEAQIKQLFAISIQLRTQLKVKIEWKWKGKWKIDRGGGEGEGSHFAVCA